MNVNKYEQYFSDPVQYLYIIFSTVNIQQAILTPYLEVTDASWNSWNGMNVTLLFHISYGKKTFKIYILNYSTFYYKGVISDSFFPCKWHHSCPWGLNSPEWVWNTNLQKRVVLSLEKKKNFFLSTRTTPSIRGLYCM